MVEINLLPWREWRRQYEEKKLKQLLMTAMSIALSVIGFMFWQTNENITQSKNEVNFLQDEIQRLTLEKQQRQELQRQLEQEQRNAVHYQHYQQETREMFVSLVEQPMKNICFNGLNRETNRVTVMGYARSTEDLTGFLQHWRAAGLFTEIKIIDLSLHPQSRMLMFKFQGQEKNAPVFADPV